MLNVERIALASEDGLLALLAGVIDPRKRRGIRHPLLTALALASLLCTPFSRAQTAAPAPEWNKVVEAAKKEGALSLYSSASTGPSNAIAEAFKKKYDINASVYRAGSADIATRVQTEESAGRPQALPPSSQPSAKGS